MGTRRNTTTAWSDRGRGVIAYGRWLPSILLLVALMALLPVVPASANLTREVPGPGLAISWGGNRGGQLGYVSAINDNDCNAPCQPAPQLVPPFKLVTTVTGGTNFALSLRVDGTVWSWGSGDRGQLGNGTTISSYTPVQVAGLSDVRAIAAGGKHSLAVKRDGTVWAWGSNLAGELGAPGGDCSGTPCSTTPVQVTGPDGVGYLGDIVAIAASGIHSLAVKRDGTVWAWGANFAGALGNNSDVIFSPAPVQVIGPDGVGALNGIVAIAAGYTHSLALRRDGTVWSWGSNDRGQVGCRMPCGNRGPVRVKGLSGVRSVAAGQDFSLALKTDGMVWSWGFGGFGQLGFEIDGRLPCLCTVTPRQAIGLSGVTAIAAYKGHSLALKGDGTLWAAGSNFDGELGLGYAAPGSHATFTRVPNLTEIRAIGPGKSTSSYAVTRLRPGMAAEISPPALTFAAVPSGDPYPPQYVTVTNRGSRTLVITGATLENTERNAGGGNALSCGYSFACEFSVVDTTFPLEVPPGGRATLGVLFAPQFFGFGRTGPSSAYMVLHSNAPSSPLAVDITGRVR